MDQLWSDLRHALRVLARNRALTVAATLTLALGVGANTAIFTVVNGVVLRPLSFPDPQRLLHVWEAARDGGGRNTISPLNYQDWVARNRTLESVGLYGYESFVLSGEGEASRLTGNQVTASFFDVLGVAPQLGRVFTAEEDRPGARVAVLSHQTWQQQFGGRADVLGREVVLNGESHTIVGVMPPTFAFPRSTAAVWTPLGIDYARVQRGNHYLFGIARLREGVALADARADLGNIAQALSDEYPNTNRNADVLLVPLREQVVGDARTPLLILLAAVGLVLLIACANVANLLLSRATTRHTEMAVRRALGAGTGRLARQFLMEGLTFALLGGALGVLFALWGVDGLLRLSGGLMPRADEIRLDGSVLGFALLLVLVVTAVLGLAQAAVFGRVESAAGLREGGRGSTGGRSRQRLRSALAVAQLALVVPLLTAAVLLIQTLHHLQNVPAGFDAEGLLTMNVSLTEARYPEAERQALFITRIIEETQRVQGVEAVGITSDLPFSGSRSSSSFDIVGRASEEGRGPNADFRQVSPDYLRAMGVPLLRGRYFGVDDDARSRPVVLINQALADAHFAGEDPIGRRLRRRPEEPPWEIVGVVGNLKHDNLRAGDIPEMYVPLAQLPSSRLYLAVRSAGEPRALLPAVRRALAAVDPEQPAYAIRTMQERLDAAVAPQRTTMLLLAVFASIALLLAAIGLYGVIAYGVAQRAHELGIRVALGAQPRDILRLVLGQGGMIVGLGLGLGVAAALAVTRALSGLLFGVRPTDPLTFAAACAVLGLVGLLGCWVPARRATRTDPMNVLRYQ